MVKSSSTLAVIVVSYPELEVPGWNAISFQGPRKAGIVRMNGTVFNGCGVVLDGSVLKEIGPLVDDGDTKEDDEEVEEADVEEYGVEEAPAEVSMVELEGSAGSEAEEVVSDVGTEDG
ncbi:hypothetical protein WICPIJ_000060 [Wickerhamomyces pijperi]|uniref:Uncharacterized protein n=1 Tax=Wickerhamomyces pijperi TaxID=599730 RepID=A0A9P8QDI3_WICPI|nr:hypothetical protein WICPIJ_000060 [Wickerhamomyces pijperi]